MNKLTQLLFALIFIILSNIALATDAPNQEMALQAELQERREFYTKVSGKQPTRENLINSLKLQNASGLKAAEIVMAFDLLEMESNKDKALVPEIIKCYNNNSDWLIHVKCSEMLLDLDEKKGIELAKKIIDDPQLDLEAKLSMSRRLVKKGKLFAYPVLREGLMTSNKWRHRMALELLEEYRSYDGKVWDEKSGKKIDISQLLKDVNIKIPTKKPGVSVEPIEYIAETNLNSQTNDSGKTEAVSDTNNPVQ
jgi:hypothetical protein